VEEGIYCLDYGDVRVEVEREGPFWGSDEAVSVVVLEDGVLRIQQILDAIDRQGNLDPIFCGAALKTRHLDAIVLQPLVHQVHGLICRFDEVVDFSHREVLPIMFVVWIKN
jgi:hypothetical protein